MALRTTPEQLAAIMEIDATITDLTPFQNMANALVDELCLASGYTDERLAVIELWLAAHFITIRDPRVSSENIAFPMNYIISRGDYLASAYGQNALLMDTAGSLTAFNRRTQEGHKKQVTGMSWLGADE